MQLTLPEIEANSLSIRFVQFKNFLRNLCCCLASLLEKLHYFSVMPVEVVAKESKESIQRRVKVVCNYKSVRFTYSAVQDTQTHSD